MSKPSSGVDKQIKKLSKFHLKLKQLINDQSVNVDTAKTLEPILEKVVRSLAIEIELERKQNEISLAIINSEIKLDLIDRDANDARIIDRQRISSEKGEEFSTVMLKNRERVGQIDAELSLACPWFRTRVCKSLSVFDKHEK